MTTIEKEDSIKFIPISKWGNHFKYPTVGTIKNLVAHRKKNGIEDVLVMINGRFYIDTKKFFEWVEKKR